MKNCLLVMLVFCSAMLMAQRQELRVKEGKSTTGLQMFDVGARGFVYVESMKSKCRV
jgi:hypothetical protein